MTEFFRFPHTPHLAWLGPGKPRDDKVLAPHEMHELLAHGVVVEEKVDGANLGFSVGEDGTLLAQNRGGYLDLGSSSGQWKPLGRWMTTHRDALIQALGPGRILFGEWCYAVHSVRYTRLPDWFLAFDVYDRDGAEFWDTMRRDDLARAIGLEIVPRRNEGCVTVENLKSLLDSSALSEGPAEGVYIRREHGGRLLSRAKLVSARFTQSIETHWSRRRLETNKLMSTLRSTPTSMR